MPYRLLAKKKNSLYFFFFANSADTVHNNHIKTWYIHQTSNIKIFFCFKKIFYSLIFDDLYHIFIYSRLLEILVTKFDELVIKKKISLFFFYFTNSADIGIKPIQKTWYMHQTSIIKIFFCFKKIILCLMFYVYITVVCFLAVKKP